MKMNIDQFPTELQKATERLTKGFPDGSSNGFSVGCRLTTLSAPTTKPGRSRKFAPYSNNIKLRVDREWIKSTIHELNQITTFRFGI